MSNNKDNKLFNNKERLALIAILVNTSIIINMVAIDFYRRTHYVINIDKLAEEYYFNRKVEDMYDLDHVSYEEALEIIRNNNLITDDIKEILLNEELLEDVFKYYKGTLMEYIVNYNRKYITPTYIRNNWNYYQLEIS